MSQDESIRDVHDTDGVEYESGTAPAGIDGASDAVACEMNDAEREQRAEWVRSDLFPHLDDVEERSDGFTLVFEGTDEALGAVLKFVHLESRCCSQSTVEVTIEPETGPTLLSFYGSQEVKELAYEGFVSRIPDDVLE